MAEIVKPPSQLRIHSLRRLIAALWPLRSHAGKRVSKDVEVDLTDVEFVTPTGMAVLAAALCDAGNYGVRVTLKRPQKQSVHEYMQRLDFYATARFPALDTYSFKRHDAGTRFRELIEVASDKDGHDICSEIANIIGAGCGLASDAKSALFCSLAEMVDNVFHHSSSTALVCAQSCPQLHEIEFAIVDCGVGFYQSMRRNPSLHNRFADATGAITLALEPEVTSNPSFNRGLGLFVTSEAVRHNGGLMWICSDDGAVGIMNGNSFAGDPGPRWPGAVVAARINTTRPFATQHIYDKLRVDNDSDLDTLFR
ncbi:STAS domain-containing protein [Sorangium sp. So ce1036]|uniref:STAS domain-containing protein n=1 Tax=Sorangium sp. So ce1036 TaxID=3133328 RepID=UPI003F03BA0A